MQFILSSLFAKTIYYNFQGKKPHNFCIIFCMLFKVLYKGVFLWKFCKLVIYEVTDYAVESSFPTLKISAFNSNV